MNEKSQSKKKLIEVALPLDIINEASSKEKSIRFGHASTLHQWWARRPHAASASVIFSMLVDDPSNYLDEKKAEKERRKLFSAISSLVDWSSYNDPAATRKARTILNLQFENKMPELADPFCGGGSIPIEAQRLGLKATASDLNPVAVIITKALVEILPRFRGFTPINPSNKISNNEDFYDESLNGFDEDFSYYSNWMRDKAFERVGHLFPKTKDGKTVIAWLWARSVICPSPACRGETPLLRSFVFRKNGEKSWYLRPIVDDKNKKVQFEFHFDSQKPPRSLKVGKRAKFRCIFCDSPPFDERYIRQQKIKHMLLGAVVEGSKGQEFVDACKITVPKTERPTELHGLDLELANAPRYIAPPLYGMKTFPDLFTNRQLISLITISDLVKEARAKIISDGTKRGIKNDGRRLSEGGTELTAYADALSVFLAFVVDRCANYWSTFTPWGGSFLVVTFNRQALPMVWDYAEGNPFSSSTGNFLGASEWISRVIKNVVADVEGAVYQSDASTTLPAKNAIYCTDPPYFDNICYSDLSDYFYVWLRRSLSGIYPDLFSTVLVPKKNEIVASSARFNGDKEKAEQYFLSSIRKSFALIRTNMNKDFPFVLFYAFKQSEGKENNASTGWETMLDALISSGFSITGTWPMRTERPTGMKDALNVLASSIVIVCRPKSEDVAMATRREFISSLKNELPVSLKGLQSVGIAPVDLAQSSIGRGMAIFSRYSKVLEADGNPMSVGTALQIINQELDSYLVEQESEMDKITRFCVAWYEQFGWKEGPFGDANTLATAKGTAVNAVEKSGLLAAKAGKVRLLRRTELSETWNPTEKSKLSVWECVQYLIKSLEKDGESGASKIIRRIGGLAVSVKELSYRLYSLCDKKGWAEDALAYNSLISSWSSISDKASFSDKIPKEAVGKLRDKSQTTLLDH